MKKSILFILTLIIGCGTFESCTDLYENQTVAKPNNYAQSAKQDTSFVAILKTGINPVTVTNSNITDSLALITVTTAPTLLDKAVMISYSLQISNTSDFSTYHVLPFSFNGKSGSDIKISYKNLNDTIYFMNSSANQRDVYARVLVTFSKGGLKTLLQSAVLKFQATPVPMVAFNLVSPNLWYIIGLGDGAWTYSSAGIGASMFPLSVVTGNVYNSVGDGTFAYTGYFKNANGFKIVSGKTSDLGTWKVQWGSSDSKLTPVFMSATSSNFTVPADGYYTITLNSITNTLTIVPATAPTASYISMGIIGEFAGSAWNTDISMTAGQATNNHIWYTTFTFTTDFTPPVGSGGLKFRANGNWNDHNWGDGHFPIGLGVNNGTNIPFKAGKYTIILNDVDGSFYFINVP